MNAGAHKAATSPREAGRGTVASVTVRPRRDPVEALWGLDAPASTPFDNVSPIEAAEYRKVFRRGYFKAWGRHLG